MTTVEQFRAAIAHPASHEVSIAGVPWPAYKVVALIVGIVVFGLVALVTLSADSALLTAAAAATVTWVGFGLRQHGH